MIHAVQQIVSDLHGTMSLPPVPVTVTTAFPDVEKPPQALQVASLHIAACE